MEVGAWRTFRTLSCRTFQAVVKGHCTGLARLGFGSRSGGASSQLWSGRNGSSSSRSGGLTSGRSLLASCANCASLSKNPCAALSRMINRSRNRCRNRFRNGFVDGFRLSTLLNRTCRSSDWCRYWCRKFNGELISVLTGITHRGG